MRLGGGVSDAKNPMIERGDTCSQSITWTGTKAIVSGGTLPLYANDVTYHSKGQISFWYIHSNTYSLTTLYLGGLYHTWKGI